MQPTDIGNWQCIATYSTLQEAAIDRGLLRSNGIEAIIPDDIVSASVYPMTLSWTPFALYVSNDDVEAARALLGH